MFRHAVTCGCDPLVALQMATINTATHFGLEREIGSVTPGRRADIILTSDLKTLPIESVFAQGHLVAQNGNVWWIAHITRGQILRGRPFIWALLTASDFEIAAPEGANSVRANVIGVVSKRQPKR